MLSIVAVTDLNQHKGLIDTDGDGVPDYLETGFEDNPNQWYEEQFFIEENSLCEDQNSLGWLDNIGLESEIEGTCSDGVSQNQAECESADANWVGNPLGNDINDANIPDAVVRPVSAIKLGLGWYKIGSSSMDNAGRVGGFKDAISNTGNIICNYYRSG